MWQSGHRPRWMNEVLSEQGPEGLHHPGSIPGMGLPDFPVSDAPLAPSLWQDCRTRHRTQYTSAQPGYRGVFGGRLARGLPGQPSAERTAAGITRWC